MQFVFKRDEDGRERIYVGDVCVAEVVSRNGGAHIINTGGAFGPVPGLGHDSSASIGVIEEAYASADEAGFWEKRSVFAISPFDKQGSEHLVDEVTVDVPVADNAVPKTRRAEGSLLTEMGIIPEDES